MTTFYEIGLSGRSSCLTCSTLEDLLRVAPHLPPGSYWIAAQDRSDPESCGTVWLSTARPEAEDWGVLEVTSPEEWRLESLAGFVAGPGHVIA